MSPAIGAAAEVAGRIAEALGLMQSELVTGEDAGGTVCVDVPSERWHGALAVARDDLGLDFVDWLSAVDEPDAEPASVDVLAHLICSTSGGATSGVSTSGSAAAGPPAGGLRRLLLRTRLPAAAPSLASVSDLWPGAAWHERETYEMFGVDFTDFDDGTGLGLRPLLLPDGFEGTPLRKSFVLAARASKPWPGAKEPGEREGGGSPSRRKMLPPGVPDPTWGPRDP
jgi:NADH-quinone oxidoreductase subunit C